LLEWPLRSPPKSSWTTFSQLGSRSGHWLGAVRLPRPPRPMA